MKNIPPQLDVPERSVGLYLGFSPATPSSRPRKLQITTSKIRQLRTNPTARLLQKRDCLRLLYKYIVFEHRESCLISIRCFRYLIWLDLSISGETSLIDFCTFVSDAEIVSNTSRGRPLVTPEIWVFNVSSCNRATLKDTKHKTT